jgi:hypothetical protein
MKGAIVPWVGVDLYDFALFQIAPIPFLQLEGDECGVHLFGGLDGRVHLNLHHLGHVLKEYASNDLLIIKTLLASANLGECSDSWTGYVVDHRVVDLTECVNGGIPDWCGLGYKNRYQLTIDATMRVHGDLVDQWSGSHVENTFVAPACQESSYHVTSSSAESGSAGVFAHWIVGNQVRINAVTGEVPYQHSYNGLGWTIQNGNPVCASYQPFEETTIPIRINNNVFAYGFPSGYIDTGAVSTASSTEGTKVINWCSLRQSSTITCWADTRRVAWRLTRRVDTDLDGIPDKLDAKPTEPDPLPQLP